MKIKKDPRTIETGTFEDNNILFIFFDQESVGNLGSQVWAEYYDIATHYQEGTIIKMISVDTLDTWKPFNV